MNFIRSAALIILLGDSSHSFAPLQSLDHASSVRLQANKEPTNDDDDATHELPHSTNNEWSIADDWNKLSESENRPMTGSEVWEQDLVGRAAFAMQQAAHSKENSHNQGDDNDDDDDDSTWWVKEALDQIHQYDDPYESSFEGQSPSSTLLDKSLEEDSSTADVTSESMLLDEELMALEIAKLVRCNEDPLQLLAQEGRFIPPLTDTEKHNVRQLVTIVSPSEPKTNRKVLYQPTDFFQSAIEIIFRQHATNKPNQLDPAAVASWYQTCLNIAPSRCGPYDARIQSIVSKFGKYGQGFLELDDFVELYMQAIVGAPKKMTNNKGQPLKDGISSHQSALEERETLFNMLTLSRHAEIAQVWRDLERHGIESPNQVEWKARVRALEEQLARAQEEQQTMASSSSSTLFHDECEIIKDSEDSRMSNYWTQNENTGEWKRTGKSSHERVQVCANNPNVPARMKDGDFVFIDEESCIGCTQCAVTAPSSFVMDANGRARTFFQDNSPDVAAAVATCPVNCMHYVGFERLVKLEKIRDDDSGTLLRNHRHFGARPEQGKKTTDAMGRSAGGVSESDTLEVHDKSTSAAQTKKTSGASQWFAHTPLHVSRRDANHKQSIYHYLRNQCYKSSACPQKGCFDCPMYASNPESNPHWQAKVERDIHIRAKYFQDSGVADSFRKKADL